MTYYGTSIYIYCLPSPVLNLDISFSCFYRPVTFGGGGNTTTVQ